MTIKDSFTNNSRIIKNTGGRNLLFLIGGIAVVSITERLCLPDTYIIDLPSNTRLPVSRDDFILTEETEVILSESIAKVFSEASKLGDVACFQLLLEKYVDFTPSPENRRVVKQALTKFFMENKTKLVPNKYSSLYNKLNPNFIISQVYDVSAIERWLDENMKPEKDIWYGTKVIFVTKLEDIFGPVNISTGDLISYLFIDENYKKKLGSNWVFSITSSVPGRKLYPVNSSFGNKEYSKYKKIGDPEKIITNETLRNYYFTVLNKLESLEDRFRINKNVLTDLANHLLFIFPHIPEDSFFNILTELLAKFSSFKGNQTYGGDKYILIYNYGKSDPNFKSKFLQIFSKNDPIITSYTVEQIIYSIRAIEEKNTTSLVVLTLNCPWITINNAKETATFFYQELLRQSANFVEFQLVAAGAGIAYAKLSLGAIAPPKEVTREIITYFLDKNRALRPTAFFIVELYKLWGNASAGLGTNTFVFLKKDEQTTAEWLNMAMGVSNIPKGKDIEINDSKTTAIVKLSGLTRKLFKQDLPLGGDHQEELKFYSDAETSGGNLQIIEIAVNEGTVKPFIEATMTELVQNSIDAIREFKPKNTSIDIQVSKTDKHVILEFIDRVGMTRDAFVYVGIPFLSTKTPSEIVTGEMGSGFFNAYRESDRLRIDTTRDKINRVSIDTPIRDERGRVVDIVKSIDVRPLPLDNQTKISISIPIENEAHFANVVSRITYTAINVIGLATAKDIRFNGRGIYVERTLVAKVGYFELYLTNSNNLKHESYLNTKGVPFAPLAGYFKNLITSAALEAVDRNIILNITHGGYTPVQTRTRINLKPEIEKDFKKIAIYAVFTKMLIELASGHKLYALDHINSNSDPRQLRFALYNIEDAISYADETYYLKFTRFYDQPSIAELINHCIDLGKDKMMNTEIRTEFIQSRYKSPYSVINEKIVEVINTWFRPKKISETPGKVRTGLSPHKVSGKYTKLTIPELKELLKQRSLKVSGTKQELVSRLEHDDRKDDGDDKEVDKEMTKVINAWVKTYWNEAKNIQIKGYNGPAPVCTASYSEKEQGLLGYFTPGVNTITINTFSWCATDRDQILSVIKRGNIEDFISGVLKKNKLWEKFFSYSFPSSTLPHELEHARRKSSHSSSSGHDSRSEPLFLGDSIKIRSFNESANAVFEKVLASGFYEKFLKALKI